MTQPNSAYEDVLSRLSNLSVHNHYNAWTRFDWPETLEPDQWWMSPELLTVADTAAAQDLDERQRYALSRWESVHLYSLNVHGIRELLREVVNFLQAPGYEAEADYLHHFVAEENAHLWFFARFCRRYGRIYPDRRVAFDPTPPPESTVPFRLFAQILVFEELMDWFNVRIARDERVHPFIRQINAVHHEDESRHIAFGRQLVLVAHERMAQQTPPDQVEATHRFLARYIRLIAESLFNPSVYRDAGIPAASAFRAAVLDDPATRPRMQRWLTRSLSFFEGAGILSPGDVL